MPTSRRSKQRPRVESPRTTVRISLAKDRTVKRLLYELAQLADDAQMRDLVALTLSLRTVLREIGHDV